MHPYNDFIIKKDSIDFLAELSKNNNRDWFNSHKDRYIEARDNVIAFAETLLVELNKHDHIETPSGKKSVYRIYKDVRFAKDKTPYNTHWSASFKRATKKLRGGYYFRIESGNSGLVGGFWGPDSDDMKRIRQDIDASYPAWNDLLADKTLVATFGSLYGEQLGSAPRGYAKDHPAIDLLRYKQFMLRHLFTNEEVLSPDFLSRMNDVFKKMRPFLNFMSDILTTDANGVDVAE
jgi:uncharacterized protein (TIGR02453 family)